MSGDREEDHRTLRLSSREAPGEGEGRVFVLADTLSAPAAVKILFCQQVQQLI